MTFQPGDLLLFRVTSSSNWIDKLIGWGQKIIHQAPTAAAYCHVGIAGPDSQHFYEARWPKVCNTLFDLTKIQRDVVLEIYRVEGATSQEVAKVMDYCRSQMGTYYDVISLFTFGMVEVGHTPYCSLLAWRAWLEAGRVLCPDRVMVSPDDLAASPLLNRVA